MRKMCVDEAHPGPSLADVAVTESIKVAYFPQRISALNSACNGLVLIRICIESTPPNSPLALYKLKHLGATFDSLSRWPDQLKASANAAKPPKSRLILNWNNPIITIRQGGNRNRDGSQHAPSREHPGRTLFTLSLDQLGPGKVALSGWSAWVDSCKCIQIRSVVHTFPFL